MKVGNIVRFLNSTGGGRVIRIDGNMAYVEDNDGFEVPALLRECVVVGEAPAAVPKTSEKTDKTDKKVNESARMAKDSPALSDKPLMETQPKAEKTHEVAPQAETAHGDTINLVLAFDPIDLKRLSSTAFEALLVNDSNYYISFTLSTRSSEAEAWTLRRASVVEPNIELSLGEFTAADLNDMEYVMVQYLAYKDDRAYQAHEPGNVVHHVDTTKFFRLHCFKESIYFDTPVISLDIVRDGKPYKPIVVDDRAIEQAIRTKARGEHRRPIPKKKAKTDEPLVVDLHITELVDTTAGMSRADMLNLQIDTFSRIMTENLRNHGRKIVFIHGKGEGVLRQALMKELNHRFKGHDVCDASFREYGFGATQVTIH